MESHKPSIKEIYDNLRAKIIIASEEYKSGKFSYDDYKKLIAEIEKEMQTIKNDKVIDDTNKSLLKLFK